MRGRARCGVRSDRRCPALDNPAVASFVGWAYFKADGTYTMYNLDDSPKLHGDWTVAADGSTRATLDFSGPTLQDRIVARFAELARRLGDSDAAVARIAKELRIPESTVRYWLRQAGELG